MKKLFREFQDFVSRGNVLDLAVGVIIGAAFGKITSSLVNDVFMPFIGWLFGDIDLSQLNIVLSPAQYENGELVKDAVNLGIGSFLSAVIDFFLVAICVFIVVKAFNKAREMREKLAKKLELEKKEDEVAAPPAPSAEEVLLTEIRDLLKDKK